MSSTGAFSAFLSRLLDAARLAAVRWPPVAAVPLLLGCAAAEPDRVPPPNPVVSDPAAVDPATPPGMAEVSFAGPGQPLRGLIYTANGPGPHPVVILLHGYPGNERNLDLAQALRRAGANVLYFNYRGSWGGVGSFSFLGSVDDARAAIAFMRGAAAVEEHANDPGRVALVGHSFGGLVAALAAADTPAVGCLVSLAGANFGPWGRLAATEQEVAAAIEAALAGATEVEGGPLRAAAARLLEELVENADALDVTALAPALADRRLLIVGGTRDRTLPLAEHHRPFVAALEAAGAEELTELVLEDDHFFSAHRVRLATEIADWLSSHCWSPAAGAAP